MIINRLIMQENKISAADITFIQKKASDHNSVKVFDAMTKSITGAISVGLHFDLNDLIIAQAKFTKTVRSTHTKRNEQVLALLRTLRDDLIKKDLELKRVRG